MHIYDSGFTGSSSTGLMMNMITNTMLHLPSTMLITMFTHFQHIDLEKFRKEPGKLSNTPEKLHAIKHSVWENTKPHLSKVQEVEARKWFKFHLKDMSANTESTLKQEDSVVGTLQYLYAKKRLWIWAFFLLLMR